MRFVAALLFWLVTTVALAVAVPAAWAQKNVVDADGYAALAASAAKDPRLQQAMASELTTQTRTLISEHGYDVNTDLVRGVAAAYTASPAFPGQFAQANRIAAPLDVHRLRRPGRRYRRPVGDRPRADAGRLVRSGRRWPTSTSTCRTR